MLNVLDLLNIQKFLKLDYSVLTTLTTSALLNLDMDLVWFGCHQNTERDLGMGSLIPWFSRGYDMFASCLASQPL